MDDPKQVIIIMKKEKINKPKPKNIPIPNKNIPKKPVYNPNTPIRRDQPLNESK